MGRFEKMNGWDGEFRSSFLSCETDTETIIRKLFVDSRPYSDYLKRLLLINTNDCLSEYNPAYSDLVHKTSIKDLREKGYVRLEPTIKFGENEEVKNYILISFDNFVPNPTNPYYRDCTVMIDIICHTDYWDIGNYRQRPLKIAGYIDGILNNTHLSGIGRFNFIGCNELVLSETLSGYCLMYHAVHMDDDIEKIDTEDMKS